MSSSEPRPPAVPEVPVGAAVLGTGVDLVHVPGLARQLTIPGTVFAERTFTPRELRDARRRADESGSLRAEHLAGRWAAKEAVIKAWSAAHNALAGGAVPPVMAAEAVDWCDIELVTDRWGRPSIRLSGAVAEAVEASLGPGAAEGVRWPVSVSHDGDYAVAVVLATAPR